MRYIISIVICLFAFECSAQDTSFKLYLSNFCHSEYPIVITDTESYNAIFDIHSDSIRGKTYKVIPENYVENFICKDGFCDFNGGYFRYDYGVFLCTSRDFITVLVSKLQYEGSTEWDYDLSEIIVISYDKNGEILSRKSITKDNDRWKSILKINQDGIYVKQIKITDSILNKKDKLNCEVYTSEYKISDNGSIRKINSSPVYNSKVVWDEDINGFRLDKRGCDRPSLFENILISQDKYIDGIKGDVANTYRDINVCLGDIANELENNINLFDKDFFKRDTINILSCIDEVTGIVEGRIWSNEKVFSFEMNESRKLKFMEGESKYFKEIGQIIHECKSMKVKDRSMYYGEVDGGGYFLFSRVIGSKIDVVAFQEW